MGVMSLCLRKSNLKNYVLPVSRFYICLSIELTNNFFRWISLSLSIGNNNNQTNGQVKSVISLNYKVDKKN